MNSIKRTLAGMLLLVFLLSVVFPMSALAASSLTISKTKVTLSSSSHEKKTITVKDGKKNVTNKATWKSSNNKVATVSKGVITATGSGRATITATYNKRQVSCDVQAYEITYKTVTISNPTSLSDWMIKVKKAQDSLCGLGCYVLNGDGKTYTYKGSVIVSASVKSTKTIKEYFPVAGPPNPATGKGPTAVSYIKVPTKIRYGIHKHNMGIDCSAKQWGNILRAIAELTFRATYSCSCGMSYDMEWEMPSSSELMKATSSGKAASIQSR